MPPWPPGFVRVPDEEWTKAPVASLAQKYDAVGRHGWYANLDPTVDDLKTRLKSGDVLVDYSGGTGLLIERVLDAVGARDVGIANVDSSPKFLALSLQKLGRDPRVAFRLIRYLKEEKRLERLDEVLPTAFADALVSANAVHLYNDLAPTLASWHRVLKPGALVHVQSGNIRNPAAPRGAWIIDDTVEAVDEAARKIVKAESQYSRHLPALQDAARIAAHDAFRKKVFLPPRPLEFYTRALEEAGFDVARVWTHRVPARVDQWHEFLVAYSDAVLGWVGGIEKIEGHAPSKEDLGDRLQLMRLALSVVLTGSETFDAVWTYIDARRP